jgi:hypothetical protein
MTAPETAQPRKWKTWYSVVGFAAVIVLWIVGSQLIQANKEQGWADRSGVVDIRLSGATTGDGWSLRTTAELETWAEHVETFLHVFVGRSPLGSPSGTPNLTVELEDGTVCETFRSYMWSTSEGSTLDLKCSYLTLDSIQQISTGTVLE